ncbi:MAG: hypothetical protein H7239_04915 [Flavobacterium sp.]|nr:hypothetical protein [Flavobacterium sp.]
MEPNKLENQIREKLNNREIIPSEMAWDRLDAMLTVGETKKSKKSFGWLFIASSILVLIAIGGFFFNQNVTSLKSIETVVTNDKIKDTTQIIKSGKVLKANPIKINQPIVIVNPNPNQVNKILKAKNINSTKSIINQNQNHKEIAIAIPKIVGNATIQKEQKSIVENPDALLSEIDVLDSNSPSNKTPEISKTSIKVDANSLLSQVSGELNQEFRETRFQKLKRNFKTVKVAVVNRNNQ